MPKQIYHYIWTHSNTGPSSNFFFLLKHYTSKVICCCFSARVRKQLLLLFSLLNKRISLWNRCLGVVGAQLEGLRGDPQCLYISLFPALLACKISFLFPQFWPSLLRCDIVLTDQYTPFFLLMEQSLVHFEPMYTKEWIKVLHLDSESNLTCGNNGRFLY